MWHASLMFKKTHHESAWLHVEGLFFLHTVHHLNDQTHPMDATVSAVVCQHKFGFCSIQPPCKCTHIFWEVLLMHTMIMMC